MSDYKRIQLDLKPTMIEMVDRIQARSGVNTRAEAIRRAISLYDAITRAVEDGGKAQLVHADESVEQLVLAL